MSSNNICYSPHTISGIRISSDNPDCLKKIKSGFAGDDDRWICPVLLHTFVPYCLTLHRGGSFAWMRNKGEVIVQCPRTDNPCVVELKRVGGVGRCKIQGKILEISADCNIKIKKGRTFILDEILPDGTCLLGFDGIFAYMEYMRESTGKRISFSCGCRKLTAIVNLEKD